MSRPRLPKKPLPISASCALTIGGVLWLSGIAYGAMWWMTYDHTPGKTAETAPIWPAASHLRREPGRGTLVIFVHPHCPCTRPSLRLLTAVLAEVADRPTIHLVFSSLPDDSPESESRCLAASIPHAQVTIDGGATETAAFRAETSGYTLYYDAEGSLRFAGGLTPMRGGARTCEYDAALRRVLHGPRFPLVATPTFGCSLVPPESTVPRR